MKKILSSLLILVLLLSSVSVSFAGVSIGSDGGAGETSVSVTFEAATFSVTIPTTLPADVDSNGNVTCASGAKITNNSVAPVEVYSVNVSGLNDWEIASYQDDFKSKKVGAKEIGFNINGIETTAEGRLAEINKTAFPNISAGGNLPLTYDIKTSWEKDSASGLEAMEVVFVIGWVGHYLEPGLYLDGVMTASWDELVEEGWIHVDNGVVTTNYSTTDYTNSSAEVLVGKLVLPATITEIGDFAFAGLKNLTEIVMPSIEIIGDYAFVSTRGLTYCMKFPETLKRIGASAFYMSNINGYILPEGIETLDQWALACCYDNMENIVIPSTIKNIGENAFGDDTGDMYNYPDVIFKGTPEFIDPLAFMCASLNIELDIDVYVPWSEGEVANAPWGLNGATIHYDYVYEE